MHLMFIFMCMFCALHIITNEQTNCLLICKKKNQTSYMDIQNRQLF